MDYLGGMSKGLVAAVLTPELRAALLPTPAELPAWQAVLARVRKLTRFDADSLILLSHDPVPGSVTAERTITVSLTTAKERVGGPLPASVQRVSGESALDRLLQGQLDACQAEVAERLRTWRAGSDHPAAAPDAARFLHGSSAAGHDFGCGTCSRRGQNNCTSCGSRGRVSCSGCNGRGQQTCFSCGGRGQSACGGCGGSGRQVGGHHACIGCNGGGTRMCLSCAGQRWVNCSRCGGSREERCSPCSGSGAINCSPCRATGRISVIGRVNASVSARDTLAWAADDRALLALLDRHATVASAQQHVPLNITDHRVAGNVLTTRIAGRFVADRFRVQIGAAALDLHGMRGSGAILDYRGIIGRLLDADIDQLEAAAAARRLALTPDPPLVAALAAVLESEAVSLSLRGKQLPAAEATLIGADFADRARAVAGTVVRRLYWQAAAPAVLLPLLLPVIGYTLRWRLPGEIHLNLLALGLLLGSAAAGMALEWGLRRRLLNRMGPVARPALRRLLGGLGHIRRARIGAAVTAVLGTVYAFRMWLF